VNERKGVSIRGRKDYGEVIAAVSAAEEGKVFRLVFDTGNEAEQFTMSGLRGALKSWAAGQGVKIQLGRPKGSQDVVLAGGRKVLSEVLVLKSGSQQAESAASDEGAAGVAGDAAAESA